MREYQKVVIANKAHKEELNAENLSYLASLYIQGYYAGEKILKDEKLQEHDLHHLSSLVELKELALASIVEHAYPLLYQEIQKLIIKSSVSFSRSLYQILFFEGVRGLEKGLLKYDPHKTTSVSYIVSWFTTYAERELLRIESPLGVPPTRYSMLKKIYAVRSKLEQELSRKPTNQEVLEYFHSGQADMFSKRGRKNKEASKANQNISIQDVIEQEELMKMTSALMSIDDCDIGTQENYQGFQELSGVIYRFIQRHASNIKPDALTVLLYHLGYNVDSSLLTDRQLKKIWSVWLAFFRTPGTTFYNMLDIKPGDSLSKDIEKSLHQDKSSFSVLFYDDLAILEKCSAQQ